MEAKERLQKSAGKLLANNMDAEKQKQKVMHAHEGLY